MTSTISFRLKPPVVIGPNAAHALANRLVGCWLLNEGAGRVVRDLSGQRHDGSFSDGPLWVAGTFGPAVEFDGIDDWISMGNCLNLGTDDITVLALVRYSAANQPDQWEGEHIAGLVGKGYLSPTSGYGLSIGQGNKICWQVRSQGTVFTIASNTALNDGQWHIAIGTCDRDGSAGVRLYVDGVQQDATADPTSLAGVDITDTPALGIGSSLDAGSIGAWRFLGQIAAVCVWKRVLAEAEIGQVQREPCALFTRRRTPVCFAFPAGTIIDLAGSAHGVSSASATLQVIRSLSGISVAHATATAVLRKAGSPTVPGTRPRLRDALANGMTSTAFQLGTTLTQGWFWARHRGGTAVYRGPSLTQVDFRRILRVAGPESSEIILPPGLSHPPDSTHCYVVRRFNGRGVSERTSTAATRVRIGPDRRLAPFAPNAVLDLKGEQVAGCKLRLTWFYSPLDQETPPQEFHVYWNGGTGPIDLEHPLGIVPYEGRRLYVCETGPLDDGQYTFAVSACDAHHAEAASLAYLVCCIASLPPEVPTILRAEAV